LNKNNEERKKIYGDGSAPAYLHICRDIIIEKLLCVPGGISSVGQIDIPFVRRTAIR